MATHVYTIGAHVSLNSQEGQVFTKVEPFTVEAQMPPVGTSLQYRIKSDAESFRRVVAEHQLTTFGRRATAAHAVPVPALHPGEQD